MKNKEYFKKHHPKIYDRFMELSENNSDNLITSFGWFDTQEGFEIWESVSSGNYKPFYDFWKIPEPTILGPEFIDTSNRKDQKHYWVTPGDVIQRFDDEFKFTYDPCPFPRPDGFDGLEADWGKVNWVNPPFTGMAKEPGKRKIGPMAWARKALLEQAKGNMSVLIFPIYQVRVISFLEDQGAEIRYAGKIRWLSVEDLTPNPVDSSGIQPCILAILKPHIILQP